MFLLNLSFDFFVKCVLIKKGVVLEHISSQIFTTNSQLNITGTVNYILYNYIDINQTLNCIFIFQMFESSNSHY